MQTIVKSAFLNESILIFNKIRESAHMNKRRTWYSHISFLLGIERIHS